MVLFDLKGGCGSTTCVVDFALITAFLSVASPQLQGRSKLKISSRAPKLAIQVKALLSGLLKLIKGAFHSPGLVLFDLKGVVVILFVLLILP